MSSFMVNLERKSQRRVDDKVIEEQLKFIMDRSTAGSRNSWTSEFDYHPPKATSGPVTFKSTIHFSRKQTRNAEKAPNTAKLTHEMTEIVKVLSKAANASKFAKNPWVVKKAEPLDWKLDDTEKHAIQNAAEGGTTESGGTEFSVEEIVNFERAMDLEEIEIPDILVNGTDAEIEAHEAFEGIFGRAAHIRVAFSSIKTMIETGGRRRNHVLFYGLPGAAKSTMFRAIQKILGAGSFLAINANSATRAGIEAIFLDRLTQTGCPPFLFIEEIEKTQEQILTVWLSILDERREVRKITHSAARKAEVNSLCFATANDKILFDRLMGGRPGHPGALSSRFNKPLYVARPNYDQMVKILVRDIALFGGQPEWANACMNIADEVGETDPRIILGYLDGGNRLLTGEYKNDIIAIRNTEMEDKARHKEMAAELLLPEESKR